MYSLVNIPEYQRISFSRFRTSSHWLKVETGRWSRTAREDRLCTCDLNEVQDERHLIESCRHLSDLRTQFPNIIFDMKYFFNCDEYQIADFIFKALETIT